MTIDLIVRDTCRLRPGHRRACRRTIRVVSIVGRFLEHARIYYFRNGGDEEYFIGSADCMKRNLESRVEVLVPVEDPALRQELRAILDTQLAPKRGAWEMQPDGSYVQRVGDGAAQQPAGADRPRGEASEGGEPSSEATAARIRAPRGEMIRGASARHGE